MLGAKRAVLAPIVKARMNDMQRMDQYPASRAREPIRTVGVMMLGAKRPVFTSTAEAQVHGMKRMD